MRFSISNSPPQRVHNGILSPMNRWTIITGLIVVLGVAYYGLSPLWRTTVVDEQLPHVTSTTTGSATSGAVMTGPAAPIVDTTLHPASGSARVVKSGDKTYVRFENFKTINGPDVYVYLANDLKAKDFVDLGRLKATEGNINYEVPPGINVADYRYVIHWCKAFSTLFNSAEINPI